MHEDLQSPLSEKILSLMQNEEPLIPRYPLSLLQKLLQQPIPPCSTNLEGEKEQMCRYMLHPKSLPFPSSMVLMLPSSLHSPTGSNFDEIEIVSDKRRNSKGEDENRSDFVPPLDGRRKLSISRSGRMKQNKKRPSINGEIFSEIQVNEGTASKEYHVHGRKFSDLNISHSQPIKTRETENTAKVKKKSVDESKNVAVEEIEKAFRTLETTIE